MLGIIAQIRVVIQYASTHNKAESVDNIARQIQAYLNQYKENMLDDLEAYNSPDELVQIKEIFKTLQASPRFNVAPEIFTAIEAKKDALTNILLLGRTLKELLETEHALSQQASVIADILTRHRHAFNQITKNESFINKAIAAYQTISDTDSEFVTLLSKYQLTTLVDIANCIYQLRTKIGRSENFGKRIAAMVDITLSMSKIEYIVHEYLNSAANINPGDRKNLKNWAIAPMQRLPRLTLFPKEINEILVKLISNPTVPNQLVTRSQVRISYFFYEKIIKHAARLNQAFKAIKVWLQQNNEDGSTLQKFSMAGKTEIIWETEEAHGIGEMVQRIPKDMTASMISHTLSPQAVVAITGQATANTLGPTEQQCLANILTFTQYPEKLNTMVGLNSQPSTKMPTLIYAQPSIVLTAEEMAQFNSLIQVATSAITQQPLTVATDSTVSKDITAARKLITDKLIQPFNIKLTKIYGNKNVPEAELLSYEAAVFLDNSLKALETLPQQAQDKLNQAIYDLMTTLLTESLPCSQTPLNEAQQALFEKQRIAKLQAISDFERNYCNDKLTFKKASIAALQCLVIAAIGLVFGVALTAMVTAIITLAATGALPPLTLAGISLALTTGWSLYATLGGATLGTILGSAYGIKSYFFAANPKQNIATAARKYHEASHLTPTNKR